MRKFLSSIHLAACTTQFHQLNMFSTVLLIHGLWLKAVFHIQTKVCNTTLDCNSIPRLSCADSAVNF